MLPQLAILYIFVTKTCYSLHINFSFDIISYVLILCCYLKKFSFTFHSLLCPRNLMCYFFSLLLKVSISSNFYSCFLICVQVISLIFSLLAAVLSPLLSLFTYLSCNISSTQKGNSFKLYLCLYSYTTLTFTKCLEKKSDENYTKKILHTVKWSNDPIGSNSI